MKLLDRHRVTNGSGPGFAMFGGEFHSRRWMWQNGLALGFYPVQPQRCALAAVVGPANRSHELMPLTPGARLGRYEVVSLLGAGGMGEVYLAKDQHLDGKEVALKVLPAAALADEAARKRLRKEAIALSRISHPNIATVSDFDTHEGVDFLVMEYVPGHTLTHRLARGPIPEKEVAALGVQIASALEEAHEHGVVHRDLKPANVVVTPKGQAKVLDFGLAKLLRPATETAATQTLSEIRGAAGTLPYMAPEQLRGEGVDARTDIFALGAVLYEITTGERPFREESSARLTDAILHQAPVTPRALRPQISQDLERIILKCLDKDPDGRYQHADDLSVDLRKLKAVTDSPPGRDHELHTIQSRVLAAASVRELEKQRYAIQEYLPRNLYNTEGLALRDQVEQAIHRHAPARHMAASFRWRPMAGALGVIAALLVGSSYFVWRALSEAAPPLGRIESLAVLPFENLSGDPEQEYFADGMTEELISSLAKIKALKVISRTSVMRYKGARKPLPEIARELGVDAVVEGTVRRSEDRVRITTQLIEAASDRHLWAEGYERDLRDVLALQSDVARSIAHEVRAVLTPQEQFRLASARRVKPEAYEAYLKGRYHWNKRAEEGFRRAIGYFERAIEEDPADARPYSGLADAYSMLGSYSLSPLAETFPKARAAAMKALEIDDTLAEAHTSLAWVRLAFDWDWTGAAHEFERAIELDPSYATAHHWYSYYLAATGQLNSAVESVRRAERLDPLSLSISKSVGLMLSLLGEYNQAEEHLRRGIEMEPGFADAHIRLGWVLFRKGENEEAIAEFQKAIDLSGESTEYLAALGTAYARYGERNKARKLIEDLKRLSKGTFVAGSHVASIYAELGENDLAFRWLEKAYEERDSNLSLINLHAGLDRLRSDSRFAHLLRRIGLPPG